MRRRSSGAPLVPGREGDAMSRQVRGIAQVPVQVETLDTLLTPPQVAQALGVPLQTLYTWRVKQAGPRGIKIGRHLRYRPADVQSWIEANADDRPAA